MNPILPSLTELTGSPSSAVAAPGGPRSGANLSAPGLAAPQAFYNFAVSVIVVSFNTRDLLRTCLHSILEECNRLGDGQQAEILVVDNASTDGSADMVAAEFASSPIPVQLIRSDVNLGFAGANNLAMELARGRYIVLLNSDAFFHPGALRRAIDHMEVDATVGIGGARASIEKIATFSDGLRLLHDPDDNPPFYRVPNERAHGLVFHSVNFNIDGVAGIF